MKIKVRLFESERGWGSNTEYKYFDSRKEAEKFVKDYNMNDALGHAVAPDYYYFAEIVEDN